MTGKPVPDNLVEMSIEQLRTLHASYWAEHAEVQAKRRTVCRALQSKEMAQQMATRASFNTTLLMPESVSAEEAKVALSMLAKGVIEMPAQFIDYLKSVVSKEGK